MVNTKSAIQRLYSARCDVYEYGQVKDPVTKVTGRQEILVLSDQACRLSIETSPQATEASGGSVPRQVIKLFMDPEVQVKPGSKIVVTQNGRTTAYKNAGQPAVYSNHQELILELFNDWT